VPRQRTKEKQFSGGELRRGLDLVLPGSRERKGEAGEKKEQERNRRKEKNRPSFGQKKAVVFTGGEWPWPGRAGIFISLKDDKADKGSV